MVKDLNLNIKRNVEEEEYFYSAVLEMQKGKVIKKGKKTGFVAICCEIGHL